MNKTFHNTQASQGLYPLLFENNFVEMVWGGHRLKPLKGLPADDQPIGESWEVSALPGHESIVKNGALAGTPLPQLVQDWGAALLGQHNITRWGSRFPLLVKLIDSESDLSIQVHPNDQTALQRHQSLGKTEMWYVLDAKPGATLFSGFREHITPYECEHRVADGSICQVLNELSAQRGDVFFIPAGRVHAIRAGLMLIEIQESSDITYRLYDYGRLGLDGKPRQLHTEQARDVIDYNLHDNYRTAYNPEANEPVTLVDCPHFTTKYFNVTRPFHRKLYKYDSFVIYICMEGNCNIVCNTSASKSADDCMTVHLLRGHTCLIPACLANVQLVPDNLTRASRIMEVYIGNRNR